MTENTIVASPVTALPYRRPTAHLVCFAISTCQFFGGLVMTVCSLVVVIQRFEIPFEWRYEEQLILTSMFYGVLHMICGTFGAIAFWPLKKTHYDVSGRFRVSSCEMVYIALTVMAFMPLTAFSRITPSPHYERKGFVLFFYAFAIFAIYVGHMVAAVGCGFAFRDILCTGTQDTHLPVANSTAFPVHCESGVVPATGLVIKSSRNPTCISQPQSTSGIATTSTTATSRSKTGPLQLPEVRSHVQQMPDSDEKVTVVTLPEAEGVVYAVPEENYVICRAGGAYVAPQSNPKLTPFFPSYTKIQDE